MTAPASAVRVGLVYPELLGTYGDRGNAVVAVERCRRRGLPAELVEVPAGRPVPGGLDLYLLGGGEDAPQAMAAAGLRASRAAIAGALDGGAVMLAVCAGFQLVGDRYETGDGEVLDGLGLVDATTRAGRPRLVGEVVVEAAPFGDLAVGPLSGFENHGGRTLLGPGEEPLGRVVAGGGNGDGTDGVRRPGLVGTYLHGPVLARNPDLADLLVGWVAGGPPAPLDDPVDDLARRLRRARVADARARGVARWWRDRLAARG